MKYVIELRTDWCKACGICMRFCPKHVLTPGKDGKPEITDDEKCVGCHLCEYRCPDFVIQIGEKA